MDKSLITVTSPLRFSRNAQGNLGEQVDNKQWFFS